MLIALASTLENWELLAVHLLEAAEYLDAVADPTREHGPRYVIRCMLSGRPGCEGEVDTVWRIDSEGTPRFITAYPTGRRR